MTVTVISASTESQLTTLERVRRELSIASTAVDDDKHLHDLINEASDYITHYCDRTFARATVEETLGSIGGTRLMLSRTPVTSVAYVEYDGSSVASSEYEIEDADAGFLRREDGWEYTGKWRTWIEGFPTGEYRNDLKVRYTAGYNMPGSTGRTLPYDLENACVSLIASWYLSQGENPTVQTERTGDASQTKFQSLDREGAPASVVRVLERYKRIA